jgi:hypothetical protein
MKVWSWNQAGKRKCEARGWILHVTSKRKAVPSVSVIGAARNCVRELNYRLGLNTTSLSPPVGTDVNIFR